MEEPGDGITADVSAMAVPEAATVPAVVIPSTTQEGEEGEDG